MHHSVRMVVCIEEERKASKRIADQIKNCDKELYDMLVRKYIIDVEEPSVYAPKEFIHDKYDIHEELQVGASSVVHRGLRVCDGLPVAVKTVYKEDIQLWKYIKGRRFPMEIYILKQVSYLKDSVTLLDYYENLNEWLIVMKKPEKCTDLLDFIDKCEYSLEPETHAKKFLYQITSGLVELESVGVVHQDIKLENIVIDTDKKSALIVDFDRALMIKESKVYGFPCSRRIAPPELIKYGWYFSAPLQVWQLGVMLYHMVMGVEPFKSDDEILKCELKFNTDVSSECQDLIKACLNPYFPSRATYEQILNHPWIKNEEFHKFDY